MVYPIKVTENGEYLSHYVPHYFNMNKRRRNINKNDDVESYDGNDDKVHYVLSNFEKSYLIELYPNRNLLSPGIVTEIHRGNDIKKRDIQKTQRKQCFYRGKIKDLDNSYVALSTCYGLVRIERDLSHQTSPSPTPSSSASSSLLLLLLLLFHENFVCYSKFSIYIFIINLNFKIQTLKLSNVQELTSLKNNVAFDIYCSAKKESRI